MAATFTVSESIQCSPEDLFRATTDMDDWPNWMLGLIRIERLTEGDFGVGTKWCEVRKMFGKEGKEVFEVTSLDAPTAYTLFVDGSLGTTGKGEYRFDHTIEADGEGSRLTIQGEVAMPGLLFRVIGGLLVGAFKKAMEKDLQSLKAHMES